MELLKEQKQAIMENGNIIVSAGAGSGKTFVLVRRILRHIKEGVDIRRLLILTFTKAAAKEMKDRIVELLKSEGLFDAVGHIDSAYITTFDSFSLSIVKKYGYYLNLDSDIKVADEGILSNIKAEIIDCYFEQLYTVKDANFLNILEKYTHKDDNDLRNLILQILNAVDLMPNDTSFFDNCSNYYDQSHIDYLKDSIEKSALDKAHILSGYILDLIDECDVNNEKLANYLKEVIDALLTSKNYEEIVNILSSFRMPQAAKGSSETFKTSKEELKSKVDEFNKMFNYLTLDDAVKPYILSKDAGIYIYKFAKEINNLIKNFKIDNSYYSFSDIAKLAIKLVNDFPEVREELKKHYHEILIDEYQDTSDLQEAFIEKISNNNIYMVGDIKQSIYRFRNANPYIFKHKYNAYRDSNTDTKIDLTKNFRSRREVIEDFNLIFNAAMTNERGDANYEFEHQMIFGQGDYETKGNVDYDSHMEIRRFIQPELFDEEGKAIKNPKVDNDLAQMVYIAKDIKRKFKNYQVLDKKAGLRKVNYKDFCILISSKTKFQTLKQVLEYFEIPVCIDAGLDLKDSKVVVPVCNLLKVIFCIKEKRMDDTYYKHALISVLRSFIFAYSDDKIFDIIKNNAKYELFDEFVKLANECDKYSIEDFFDLTINRFNIYERILSIGDILTANVELEKVKNILADYINLGYNTFDACSNTIAVLKGETKLEYKNYINPNVDMVRIMTIHKSKGLEYPICYFPFLNSKFNITEIKQRIGFSRDFGLFLPSVDGVIENKTIIKDLIVENIRREEISERVRVFYVALTRAKEKMILLYSDNNVIKPREYNSFRDIVKQANINHLVFDVDPKDYQIGREYTYSHFGELNGGTQILENLRKDYRSKELKQAHASKKVSEIIDSKTLINIKTGLNLHTWLEQLDFKNPNLAEIDDEFVKEKIKALLNMNLFAKIGEANVYQEYEFSYKENDDIVHGIIDLFLVYEDHVDLIDYKLFDTSKTEYIKQLATYKKYLAKVINLPIKVYLVSLVKSIAKEIDL